MEKKSWTKAAREGGVRERSPNTFDASDETASLVECLVLIASTEIMIDSP